MGVDEALKEILETVKFSLTIQQQDTIRKVLQKLDINSFDNGYETGHTNYYCDYDE